MTVTDLTDDERDAARAIFEGRAHARRACWFCAGLHDQVASTDAQPIRPWQQPCPRVKRAAWHPSGELAEVEYWPNGEWEDEVVFPRDVYDEDEDE